MTNLSNQVPDFIQNLGSSSAKDSVLNNTSNQPVPDFIKNLNSRIKVDEIDPNIRLKNKEVSQELGIDLDTERSQDENAVKSYIDALSEDDYDTRLEWKNQGYSLEARKALMDNKDILSVDPRGNGYIKYTTLNKDDNNALIKAIYHMNQGYEQILHPWSLNVQDWLENKIERLDENLDKEKAFNAMIERQDPYTNLPAKMAEGKVNDIETIANMVEIPRVAGSMLLHLSKRFVQAVDNLYNIGVLSLTEGTNLIDKFQGEEKTFNVGYGENRSNIIGSFIQTMAAGIDATLVSENPLVFYFLGMLGATNNDVEEVITKIVSKPFELFDWLMSQQTAQDLAQIAGLNSSDVQGIVELGGFAIFEAMNAFLGRTGRTITKSEAYQQSQYVLRKANQEGKDYANYKTQGNRIKKQVAEDLPVGTEVLDENGNPIAVSTEGGSSYTTRGALNTSKEWIQSYIKGFKEYISWFRRTNGKGITLRDPNAPVAELPDVDGVAPVGAEKTVGKGDEKINEVSEVRQQEIDEKGFYTDQKPVESKKSTKVETKVEPEIIEKNKSRVSEAIDDFNGFIKGVVNKLSGKKGGLNKELSTKLQENIQLQNEFKETIEPYLKNGGADNPSGVIKEQLTSLVESIRDKIETKQENNRIFRKGQEQYKAPKTIEEKIQQKIDDEKLSGLLKVINKKIENPEKLLEYLIKLSEERKAQIEEFVPEFERNLQLIQDTLDLTKALVKSDLVEKVISFRSMSLKRKAWIRKWLYKKLRENYRKAGIEYNLNKIENMINKMTDQQLMDLENKINNMENQKVDSSMRGYSEEEVADLNERGYMLQTYEKTLQGFKDAMNKKRYGTNKTIGEYLKEKQVPLSVTTPGYVQKITRGGGVKGGLAGYNGELDRILLPTIFTYEGMIFHEFGHRVLNQLGTRQMMDIITYISKRDNISADAAFERRAEYFRNYMRYNNIDGKKYLIKNLGEDITNKINATTERIKEEVWDLFDINNETELEINQIMNDVKHDTPAGQDITSRRPEPLMSEKIGDREPVRYERLKSWDPNVKEVKTNPYFDQQIEIYFNDGRKPQKRSEYRKGLSEEQLKELDVYENDYLNQFIEDRLKEQGRGRKYGLKGEGEFNYDTLENEKDLTEIMMDGTLQTKESLGIDTFQAVDYLRTLKDVDPDILGLVEKDGQIYVKYMIESQRERYEMSDRPGYVEVKEVPAKDYFTEEEFNKLPKELQEKITGKEIIKYTKNNRSTHPESPTYYRTPDHQQLDSSELRWDGKDIGITEFFKDPNGLYYIKYLKPKIKNKYQKMESNVLPEIDELDTILGYEPLGYQVSLLEKDISEDALRKINNQLPDKWKDIANQQLNIMIDDFRERFNQNRLLSSMEEEILGEERLKNASMDEIISIIKNDPETVLYQDAVEEGDRDLRIKLTGKNIIQQKYEILRELEDLSNNHLEEWEKRDLDFLSNVMERPNLEMFIDDFSDFFDKNGFLKRNYRRTTPKWTKENPWPREKLVEEMNKIDNIKDFENHIKKHFGKEYMKIDDVENIIYNSNWDTPKYESYQKELKKWESKFDRLGEFLYIPKKD